RFASDVLAVLVPEPQVDDVGGVGISASEHYSPLEAAHEIAQFAGGPEVLLAQARLPLVDQPGRGPGDASGRRGVRSIEEALSGPETPGEQAGSEIGVAPPEGPLDPPPGASEQSPIQGGPPATAVTTAARRKR
ncbi:MAG: hypothetical protein ACYCUG_17345, partial [Acidimicrobiales bacterium]